MHSVCAMTHFVLNAHAPSSMFDRAGQYYERGYSSDLPVVFHCGGATQWPDEDIHFMRGQFISSLGSRSSYPGWRWDH